MLWDDKESVDLAMNKGAVMKQTPLLLQERITKKHIHSSKLRPFWDIGLVYLKYIKNGKRSKENPKR